METKKTLLKKILMTTSILFMRLNRSFCEEWRTLLDVEVRIQKLIDKRKNRLKLRLSRSFSKKRTMFLCTQGESTRIRSQLELASMRSLMVMKLRVMDNH